MNPRTFSLLVALVPALAAAQPASAPSPAVSEQQLGASKMLENSAGSRARMKAKLKLVLDRMEAARNEKDVVRLNCLNEKLTQIKALVRVAEQADVSLQEATTTSSGAAESEYVKIEIARRKVENLSTDAEACASMATNLVDESTRVEVEVPANVAEAEAASRKVATGYGAVPTLGPSGFELIDRRPPPGWNAPPAIGAPALR